MDSEAYSLAEDGESYIKFTTKINFGEQNKNFAGINFFFGQYGAYEFNCNYRQWLRTDKEEFKPLVKDIARKDRILDSFVSWDSTFDLKFFDQSYTEPMNPDTFFLGSTMYFSAIWKERFTEEFPVEFHLSGENIFQKRTLFFDMLLPLRGCLIIKVSSIRFLSYF